MKNVLIGGAWPYANDSLHIGHIAALLPGDIIARYYREKGDPVYYVSGSDYHGTPVTIRARQEDKQPEEISDYYQWAIVYKENNQVIGSISVVGIDESIEATEIGYCIGYDYWNKGITTEAFSMVISFLFDEVNGNRISVRHECDKS